MHVATCSRKRKQKKSRSDIQLAWGIHVVFPSIVLLTSTMKLIAQLIDTRLSNIFPVWSNIVDPAPYRSTSATLRPCFSFKMIECPICSLGSSKKRNRAEQYIYPIERLLSEACRCFNGRKVEPSTYTYKGSFLQEDGPICKQLGDTHAVLVNMSIIPEVMGTFNDELFIRPDDMGEELDVIPQAVALFPSEKRTLSGFQKRKSLEAADACMYPNGHLIIREVLKQVHESYLHLAIHNVCMNTKSKLLIVTVKGRGSRYCLYQKRDHNSNRVYFTIDTRKQTVTARCFDDDCKKEIVSKPIVRPLSFIHRHTLMKEFGFSTPRSRIATTAQVQTSTEPAAKTKTEIYEEKRKAYMSAA